MAEYMNQIDRQIMILMLQTRSDQLSEYRYISRAKFQVIWICLKYVRNKVSHLQALEGQESCSNRLSPRQASDCFSLFRACGSLGRLWLLLLDLRFLLLDFLLYAVVADLWISANSCWAALVKSLSICLSSTVHWMLFSASFMRVEHSVEMLLEGNPQTNNSTCSFNIQANRKNRHMQRQEKQESFQKQYSVVLQLSPKHSFSAWHWHKQSCASLSRSGAGLW